MKKASKHQVSEEERQSDKEEAVILALKYNMALIRRDLEVHGMKKDGSTKLISISKSYDDLWSDALNGLKRLDKNNYVGIVVEESLVDSRMLNNLKIVSFSISKDPKPENRWHLYKVLVSKPDIQKISKNLNSTKWYAHFWKDRDVIVVFKNKTFTLNYDKKETWKKAVDYGLSIGIPKKQLDFVID